MNSSLKNHVPMKVATLLMMVVSLTWATNAAFTDKHVCDNPDHRLELAASFSVIFLLCGYIQYMLRKKK